MRKLIRTMLRRNGFRLTGLDRVHRLLALMAINKQFETPKRCSLPKKVQRRMGLLTAVQPV